MGPKKRGIIMLLLSSIARSSAGPTFKSLELIGTEGPALCDYRLVNKTEESIRDFWDNQGIGKFHDEWLKEHGEVDWVQRMDEDLTKANSDFRCNSLDGSQCPTPEACDYYLEKGVAQLYWILLAAKNHHDFLSSLDNFLQEKAIKYILDIPEIEDIFKNTPEPPKPKDVSLLGVIQTAFILASAIPIPEAPEITALLSVGVGAVGFARLFEDEEKESPPDHSASVSVQLGGAFQAAIDGLNINLDLAMTGQDRHRGLTTASLPGVDTQGNYTTNIARYFAGGQWLISNIDDTLEPLKYKIGVALKQTMIMGLLKAQGYFVFIDTNVGEDECLTTISGVTAKRWIDGFCVDFWQLRRSDDERPWVEADYGRDRLADSMTKEEYGGVDLRAMYSAAITCARKYPYWEHEPDVTKLPLNGTIPECFYNYPVFAGRYWTWTDYGFRGDHRLCHDEYLEIDNIRRQYEVCTLDEYPRRSDGDSLPPFKKGGLFELPDPFEDGPPEWTIRGRNRFQPQHS